MIRTPLRAALRFALSGCLGLATVASLATVSHAATEPEKVLPDSTLFFFDVKNVAEFRAGFNQSQFGQLLADPAIKPLKDSISEKLNQASKDLKAKLGVTIDELLSLPQGPAHVAIVSKTGGPLPIALLVSADAGKNEKAMTDVMTKSTKQAEEANAKVGTESFKGLTLHIIQPPKDDDKPNPPLIWTNQGSVFYLATDIEALKDILAHADGRSDALGSVDSFKKSKAKLGTDAPVSWFFDINKAVKLAVRTVQAKNGGGQNIEGILDQVGINGLKSAAGTFAFNSGAFDSVSKVYFLAPQPTTGVLKLFQMPPAGLRPEPWVPATVASYQTMSWELDGAYEALNNLVNTFQPGMLNVLEQQLVGPNGGEPLSLKKDIFGPLGDRLTMISDFKKPVKEDSQRLLFSIALDDSKAFTNTLNKVLGMTGAAPAKREFNGTTIYDFKLPEMPQAANGANNNPFKNGTASLAIAKDTLYIATEPTLLEATLRGGAASLADSPSFAAVAKQIPAKTSSLTYTRSDEQARVTYDMIKSGQYEEAFKKAPNGPDVSKVIDKDKIPDFSVFVKYLSEGGGFGVSEEDGVTFTNFTLKKMNP